MDKLKHLSTTEIKHIEKFSWGAFFFPGLYLLWARCYQSFLPLMIASFLSIFGLIPRVYTGLNARKRAYLNSSKDYKDFYKGERKREESLAALFGLLLFI